MSLFQYGGKRIGSTSQSQSKDVQQSVPSHLPQHHESGLSIEEHANIATSISDLSDPHPPAKRKKRGKYVVYSDKDRARIGRYASENGNERARRHFLSEFPTLTESTIRNFKRLYLNKLKEVSKKDIPEVITQVH